MAGRRLVSHRKAEVLALQKELEEAGCEVVYLTEQELIDLSQPPTHDVYLMLSRAPFWFSYAHLVENCGGIVLNAAGPSQRAFDKIVSTGILSRNGVPVPPSHFTVDPRRVESLLHDGPLLLKKRTGERSEGLAVIRRPEELDDVVFGREPVLLQRLLQTSGPELKLYVIGADVFAFEKTHQGPAFDRTRYRIDLQERHFRLAQKCRKVLELEIFGIDLIATPQGELVVDINLFPGFRGIAEAPRKIAALVRDKASRKATASPT